MATIAEENVVGHSQRPLIYLRPNCEIISLSAGISANREGRSSHADGVVITSTTVALSGNPCVLSAWIHRAYQPEALPGQRNTLAFPRREAYQPDVQTDQLNSTCFVIIAFDQMRSIAVVRRRLQCPFSQLADFDPRHGLVVRPFFGRPDDATRKYDLFVLMPFTDSMRPVYDDHIKKVASELSLSIARADDFFSAHSVMADVWSAIFSAKAIIADCTARNPNVFYEIGLAHVLGKPVILITQKSEDVPFDVRHLRYLEYTFTPRGMVDFERALGETLRNVLNVG